MKTLGCTKRMRENIKDVALPNESVDCTINRILDELEADTSLDVGSGRTNINIKDNTYDRLVALKVDGNEPIMSVLRRAIIVTLKK